MPIYRQGGNRDPIVLPTNCISHKPINFSAWIFTGKGACFSTGDPQLRTRKNSYYHDTTDFFVFVKEGIIEKVAPLYAEGWSLRDIQAHTGIGKTTIRKALLENGVSLRGNTSASHLKSKIAKGKQAAQPPYGFCYFQGKVVSHPKEQEVLLLIYKLWQKGDNANTIFKKLNSQRTPSRMAKAWSWNAVDADDPWMCIF